MTREMSTSTKNTRSGKCVGSDDVHTVFGKEEINWKNSRFGVVEGKNV